jgi:hypothetical protein
MRGEIMRGRHDLRQRSALAEGPGLGDPSPIEIGQGGRSTKETRP